MGKQLEWKTVDYRFRSFTIPERADSNVVLVAIDNTSLDYFEDFGVLWKWPRNFYGIVVNYFTSVGAKAVIFDMMFDDPDIDRAETDASETDGAFGHFIRQAGNVILGAEFTMNETDVTPDITPFSIEPQVENPLYSQNFKGGIIPIEILLKATRGLGFLNIRPDNDGIIRRVPLIYSFNGNYYPQIAYSGFISGQKHEDIIVKRNAFITNQLPIPVDKNDKYFINWYGPAAKMVCSSIILLLQYFSQLSHCKLVVNPPCRKIHSKTNMSYSVQLHQVYPISVPPLSSILIPAWRYGQQH